MAYHKRGSTPCAGFNLSQHILHQRNHTLKNFASITNMSILSIRQIVVAAVFSMMAAGAVASPANLEPRICCGNAANCPAHCVRVSNPW